MRRRGVSRGGWVVGALATSLAIGQASATEAVAFSPDDARTVFVVAKSQNKNQVHYGVHLDARCNPVGTAPVFGYWRMLEERGQVEPILGMEEPAYGLADGQSVQRAAGVTTIRVRLRAFPERPVVIVVTSAAGRCEAVARSPISGTDARLTSIYVKLRWPFGVEYMLLRGFDGDNQAVEEWIRN